MEVQKPHRTLFDIATYYWISQAVYVAARLQLADRLANGPRTADELAAEAQAHPQSLYRLLRALASVGIFAEDGQQRFTLTPLAEGLRDRPGSFYPVALMMGEEHYHAWSEFLYSVQTGKPAFDRKFGEPIFDYLAKHPEPAKIFDAAMTGIHGPETQAMIDAYDFSGISALVDVGGGNGSVISAILKKYPSMRGILYDLPGVIGRAQGNLQAEGVAARCQTITGSFFESAPAGGDAYLMRHILHDWTDEQCAVILGHIRKGIAASGRLLVIEMVIEAGNAPQMAKLLDLNMLAIPGGRERTEAEYRTLFAASGFRLERVVPSEALVSVLESRPA